MRENEILGMTGKNEKLYLFGKTDSRRVFFQLIDEHDLTMMDNEAAVLKETGKSEDWCIAAFLVDRWNQDLTPWEAAPVFGKESFGDGAKRTLSRLLDTSIPKFEASYPLEGRKYFLCGYSLAGLFSLWAGMQTDFFEGIAAVSPSVWYPGWIGYASANPYKAAKVYLSLGDKEEKAKNPIMASVGGAIRTQYRMLQEAGIICHLDWNPGNHFADSDRRMARGLAWLLAQEETVQPAEY